MSSLRRRFWFLRSNRVPSRPRTVRLLLEPLENRLVPSAAGLATYDHILAPATSAGTAVATSDLIVAHPGRSASPLEGAMDGPTFTPPYTPAQIRQAYGFNQIAFGNGKIAGDGAGQTIAIVDAFDDPNIASDLHTFDAQFGLPDPNLTVVKQIFNGQTTGVDPTGGWEMEESLDVEWAHAMAPRANILLVEAYDNSYQNLLAEVQFAASQPGVSVVSMSFGGSEMPDEDTLDQTFTTPAGHAGVTFVASSGDMGMIEYPAASPNVLAVGGTSLSLDSSGNYQGETTWPFSGGGISAYETEPDYQRGVQNTGMRTSPDVAYDADPYTGFWVYDSFPNDLAPGPWVGVGGTSAGAPQWSALIAIADQGRALEGVGTLDGRSQTLPMLYSMPSTDFHEITGSRDLSASSASPAFDMFKTGLGTPHADRVVAALTHGLSAQGYTLDPVAGQPFTATVASFTDPSGSSGTYSAFINWGNGTTSSGQVVNAGNGEFQVVGTHTYAASGSYAISVQIQGSDGQSATAYGMAQVSNPLPVPQPPSPPPQATAPSPFQQAATDALHLVEDVESGNDAAAISAWLDFASLDLQSPASMQPQLLLAFYDDLLADISQAFSLFQTGQGPSTNALATTGNQITQLPA